jgi:hypothetical protein
MTATLDITDVFADAVRVPVTTVRPGDYVFTPMGDRIRLTDAYLTPKGQRFVTVRDDGVRDRWDPSTEITVVRGTPPRCACAHNRDGSVTTLLCPVHSDTDPCLRMSHVTGRRRKGTIRHGVCTACGHGR